MIIFDLVFLGLVFGSFVNAWVWRLQKQLDEEGMPKKQSKKHANNYSILRGRSMCPKCKHTLAAKDLVPIFSWLWLRGRCRYCRRPIHWQYPLVELITPILFVLTYIFWPETVTGAEWIVFGGFILTLVVLITLAIYDIKTYLLPSKLIYIGITIYSISLILYGVVASDFIRLGWAFLSALVYFALFFSIFIMSVYSQKKKWSANEWLGFGDVRLAFLLGLCVGYPTMVFIALFLASIIGLLVVLPAMLRHKATLGTKIPFGPYLIVGCVMAVWWGSEIVDWYTGAVFGL